MQRSQATATVHTPIGDVRLCVAGGGDIAIVVARVPIPPLPAGMMIDGIVLATISLPFGATEKHPVRLRVEAEGDMNAESGEWLESASFLHPSGGVVQVATRDCEWLSAKGVIADWAEYTSVGLSQTFRRAPAGSALHVSVAWCSTRSGPQDASCWYAVDLALPGQPTITSPAA